ncbi:hypothetical protein [Methylobacterium dankookense]|uniref:Uncharacterized protein n=1 Tax=Methylobacterium dankookense TaxID=560405 RepID=A0A564G6Q1_9HYPH|nr:hypothetical protein [Methylobacterium dankookense]GJD58367.1 hypothetical protein IFDJLNFL_4286 [Methylobacterium dankookense]VUF15628.1 hypothetical protein MTDSW087_05372 [Methylobacterium dankookense]
MNFQARIETRLPEFPALWGRLPLPFTPAEAWARLPVRVQAEIGAAVIGMALANYIAGDGLAEADQFLDEGLRIEAGDAAHAILNTMDNRLWSLFPDLYGPDGDHPRWALEGGFAR